MANILIYGVSSFKNKGVEALVKSTLDQFSSNDNVVIATFDYNNDSKKFRNVVSKYVNHYKNDLSLFSAEDVKLHKYYESIPFDYYNFELLYQKDVIYELEKCDICIHIGGDNYCYNNNTWIYAINRKAKELGKKLVLWGASLFDEIDPIKDIELLDDLNRYDLLLIRDVISYNAIINYISSCKVRLVTDCAFSLKKEKVTLSSWYQKRDVVGLNLSPLTIDTKEKFDIVCGFIDYIVKFTKYSISLIPHVTVKSVSDVSILKKIKTKYKNNDRVFLENGNYNCSEIKYIISNCKFLIAARTHASIAAYSSFVPTLVIGYSVKSKGIAENIFGTYKNYVLPINELSVDNLISSFCFMEDNRLSIIKLLKNNVKPMIDSSKLSYDLMINFLSNLSKKTICDSKVCCGCSACADACPVSAIKMEENREGFIYPNIDISKCINCGKCRQVCPNLCKKINVKSLISYAAKNKNEIVRKNSSSGGIFSSLAEYFLENNGIVYGAAYDSKMLVHHIRITNKNQLLLLRGSKYAQSICNGIFKTVKNDLDNGLSVLFSGTPCQISALLSFLKKDYDNLLTVSIICHGVLNNKILKKNISEFEDFYHTKVNNISFRNKKNGWENFGLMFETDSLDKFYSLDDSSFMFFFLNNLSLRESCYNCNFKNCASDIILGDYWGIYNVHKHFFDDNGVSAVIINSEKGKKYWNNINGKVEYIKTNYDDILKFNPSLEHSVSRPKYRTTVFNFLLNNNLFVSKMMYLYYMNEKKIINYDRFLIEKEEITNDFNNAIDNLSKKCDEKVNELCIENNRLFVENQNLYKIINDLSGNFQDILNSRRFKILSKVFSIYDMFKLKK